MTKRNYSPKTRFNIHSTLMGIGQFKAIYKVGMPIGTLSLLLAWPVLYFGHVSGHNMLSAPLVPRAHRSLGREVWEL